MVIGLPHRSSKYNNIANFDWLIMLSPVFNVKYEYIWSFLKHLKFD